MSNSSNNNSSSSSSSSISSSHTFSWPGTGDAYVQKEHKPLELYSSIDWSKYVDTGVPKKKVEPTCECGAFKASGFKKGQLGHSDWCPWSK